MRDALTSTAQSNEDDNSSNKCAIKGEPMDNTNTSKLHVVDKEIETR